jgi:predicted porin
MKKSLIALAVLAASGAVMAQSSVTLYGLADVSLRSNSVDKGDGKGSLSQTELKSGGADGDRWGIKGSEDLGGGLKVNFNLESGFNIDTGEQINGLLFGRQAWVGLSGSFGALQLGLMTTAMFNVSRASNAVFDAITLAPLNNIGRLNNVHNNQALAGATGNTLRFNNALSYSTPTMGGFNATIQYALGENKDALRDPTLPPSSTNLAGAADSAFGLIATYAAGPVGVQFAYQDESCKVAKRATGTGSTPCAGGTDDRKFTLLGAEYNFGAAVLKGRYGRAANIAGRSGADSNEYHIGLDVPVSAVLLLSASYAKANDNSTQSQWANTTGSGDVSRQGYGLGAKYSLSKRTSIYGGYEADKQTQDKAKDYKHSLFAVGLNHTF